jgi:hypothetical protein
MLRNTVRLFPLGFPVSIDAATADAAEAARDSWADLEARFDARPLRLQIRTRPGPAPVKTPPRFRARPGWFQLICDASNRGAFVPAARAGRLSISHGLLCDRPWFRQHLLEPLVLAALDQVFFTPLHAACVTWRGQSVLLCGNSGAGKSCLTYACVRRGWTLVSDDAVHLSPLPENIVAGGSTVIRLREPARPLFPELRDAPAVVAPNGKIALEIAAKQRGFATAQFAHPSHLVFLSRRAGRARLRAFPADRALEYFLKYLWHCDTAAHEKRLRELLSGGARVLEYDSVDAGVDRLEELIG